MSERCKVFWNTRETTSAKDSHGDKFSFEVSRIHECMFVVGTYHPTQHECSICHEVSDALTKEKS